ncbi:MAG: hypothetical protein VR70_12325 [Rhodospirillaceae bacterium BRH_c57]|nr:MAG: hypothetical protein VR70_12325 [Rhodospirillaceae bacterium BRH_c57]
MSKQLGRPPKGDRPLTAAELQREYQQRLRERGIPKKDVMLKLIGAAILESRHDLASEIFERIMQRAVEEGEKKGYKPSEIKKKIEEA